MSSSEYKIYGTTVGDYKILEKSCQTYAISGPKLAELRNKYFPNEQLERPVRLETTIPQDQTDYQLASSFSKQSDGKFSAIAYPNNNLAEKVWLEVDEEIARSLASLG